MTDPNSMTPLLIMTLTVIGLVIVLFGIASMVKRRKRLPTTDQAADAAVAVASLEKAKVVAKKAEQMREDEAH